MLIRLIKLGIAIVAAFFLGYLFIYTKPPESWEEASVLQILAVFIALLIFFTFLLDIFMRYLPHSFLISLGLLMLVALQASGQLSLITSLIVILIIFLSLRLFPKVPLLRLRGFFTLFRNIPKLTKIEKQSKSRHH